MLYILFRLCCGIITLISYCTGFTYEEVNSILFIYGEPIIIGLCNLFILFKSFNHKLLCVFITLYNFFFICNIKDFHSLYSIFITQCMRSGL